MTLTFELLVKYQAHQDDADLTSAWAYHTGKQVVTHKLSATTKPETLFGIYTALKELKSAYNAHDADTIAHTTGGTIQVAQAVLSGAGTAGGNDYIYGLHYTYRYKVEALDFLERGAVEIIAVNGVTAPDVNAVTLSNIPVLVSGSLNNWDDANIKVSIFRTTASGGTLYFIGEINNGTTSFVDTTADTVLDERPTCYTEGGVVDNDMPPPAKFAEIVNDVLLLGSVKEGDIIRSNRVRICRSGLP
jgi:hypothetical protein